MSDEEIDEIPRERFMERESILRAKLKDALLERDEARKELVRMDEVYAHEARKERDGTIPRNPACLWSTGEKK